MWSLRGGHRIETISHSSIVVVEPAGREGGRQGEKKGGKEEREREG